MSVIIISIIVAITLTIRAASDLLSIAIITYGELPASIALIRLLCYFRRYCSSSSSSHSHIICDMTSRCLSYCCSGHNTFIDLFLLCVHLLFEYLLMHLLTLFIILVNSILHLPAIIIKLFYLKTNVVSK